MNITDILGKYKPDKDQLLMILHEVQNSQTDHSIHQEDITAIAQHLSLTKAQVFGVVNYYSMFHTEPRGKHIITVCKSPVCHIKEADAIIGHLEKSLGIKMGETSTDAKFTLEHAECLGRCDEAPVMSINQDFYGHLDAQKIDEILAQFEEKKTTEEEPKKAKGLKGLFGKKLKSHARK